MGIPERRYSRITQKHPREICLLRSFPCVWGKCSFCDYIEDYPNYHFRLREANGKYLYMCVRLNG